MTAINQPWRIEQTSKIGPFLWLGFWTSLLTLPTLTLFRFWTRTMFRRRLWADTAINGEPLEYTGKGLELFLGFLIATVVVVAPTVGVLLAAQFFLEPLWAALVIAVVYLGMLVLLYVAIFLARRYQFSRTSWRGVRLQQGGSALGYAAAAIGYSILTGVTFGWYGPAMRLRLERKLWNQAQFGTLSFRWEDDPAGPKEPVYLSYALTWFGGFIYLAGIVALGVVVGRRAVGSGGVPDLQSWLIIYAGIFVLLFLYFLLNAWHEAVMVRRITQSIRIDGVALRSRFSTWDMLGLIFTNALLVVFTLGFGALAAQMRVWRAIAHKLEAEGALDFAAIGQAERGPRTGEGLADAFDLSGGF